MDELNKIKRVIQKVIPEAPHEVMLVLDGSTGQNAIEQAKAFTQATDVTALTITKLDGTAKGGVVLGIANQFKIPCSGLFVVTNYCNENAHTDLIKNHAKAKELIILHVEKNMKI